MRASWLRMATVLGLIAGLSCSRLDESHRTLREAEKVVMKAYVGSDPKVALQAMLAYRQQVIETKGYAGFVDIHKTLVPTDARLFVLSKHLGFDVEAERWLSSYKTNLNYVRRMEGQSALDPSGYAVTEMVERLDRSMQPRWKGQVTLK